MKYRYSFSFEEGGPAILHTVKPVWKKDAGYARDLAPSDAASYRAKLRAIGIPAVIVAPE